MIALDSFHTSNTETFLSFGSNLNIIMGDFNRQRAPAFTLMTTGLIKTLNIFKIRLRTILIQQWACTHMWLIFFSDFKMLLVH